ncbi:amino acid ABC transporter permease [Desulfobaculum bizertense]|uniref:Amino acid ABC transporter membrane protein 2, PAAT family n=1 Tax=Desulfobaculum bizertense DSM 18034 TaxID=1121442 RepID=A0A1T4VF14_9BACT|nr:amino acid ABC transporter permease [Desulfobaculum bizertense]UIJ37710.1 amino acid ABC transporter permease [Desulfobaculum bizertense]SKA63574.1 amino acid ABC transporter membrane protein 2, PAAT family [Desulfobaculum bizertense DSM 18034]
MLHTKKPRITPLDIGIILVIAAALAAFGWRVDTQLDYEWKWTALGQYFLLHDPDQGWIPGLLTQGLLTTIKLSLWTMLFATIIGVVMGLARTSRSLFNRLIGQAYVGLVRNIPPLVLIFIFYFFISDQIFTAMGIDTMVRNAPPWVQEFLAITAAPVNQFTGFLSALVTLAIYEGAYITEHVRAGVQAVSVQQYEAAYALGLSPWHRMRHVIFPQAMTHIMPPLTGQFISTIKDSAIVSVISIQELTFQGMELMAATYMTFEIWIVITILYLILTVSCSVLSRYAERWFRRHEV